MPLDDRFITGVELEELFRDKDTGEPLAFGTVEFFQDDNRVVPKLVYTLQNGANPPTPPNYSYVPLPNPITLSAIGTISDNNGNNVPIYYFPFQGTPTVSNGSIQLYYVVIRNSLGVIQFTREAWPNTTPDVNPAAREANLSNQLSNPQFVDINFALQNPSIIPLTGVATTTIPIAARWDLIVNHTATTTVTVQQNAITGVSALPGNPPFTLTITPGLNIAAVTLRQRLANNPDIFSRAAGGTNGFLASSILLSPGSNITMTYQPNGQPAQNILVANNVGGSFAEFTNTVQLAVANNPSDGNAGFVDINIILPIVGATTLSNVQIVGLSSNVANVLYDEVTSNREKDQLFNYYNPLLQFKPIQSYLIGWDFPLNPFQFLGSAVAAIASGANTSNYFWDQTIVFQSTTSGVSAAQVADGSLVLTSAAVAGTRLALVQYLDAPTAREMLTNLLACNLRAFTNQVGGVPCTISLWYTTGTLPNMNTNSSIVATLDASGKPATFNIGTQPWIEVTRSNLQNATFTLAAGTTYTDYGLIDWKDLLAGSTTATFFAIVVGFGTVTQNNTITIQSISCVPGQIPTIPAPKTQSQTLLDCQRFYWKTFQRGVVPATGLGHPFYQWVATHNGVALENGFSLFFPTEMRTAPALVTFNPVNNNAQAYDNGVPGDCSGTTAGATTTDLIVFCVGNAGTTIGNALFVSVTADARFGIV